jgi:sporulation protein YlmC with PRC-barrel domain
MRRRNLIAVLLTGGLALATVNLTAQRADEAPPTPGEPQLGHQAHSSKETRPTVPSAVPANMQASSLIGMPVHNGFGDRLGKLQDVIVNLESCSAPFAIVESGGTLGIGAKHIAVPLTDLKWSSDSKQLLMTATKEEFQSANSAPTGAWMAVAGEDWIKNVDKFYGQPTAMTASRYERQESTRSTDAREQVRQSTGSKTTDDLVDPLRGSGTEQKNLLSKPTNDDLTTRVNSLVREDLGDEAGNLQVSVKDGIVTLTGRIPTAAQKQSLETRIKSLNGVQRIEDKLETTKD